MAAAFPGCADRCMPRIGGDVRCVLQLSCKGRRAITKAAATKIRIASRLSFVRPLRAEGGAGGYDTEIFPP